jgi:hypothetical protein
LQDLNTTQISHQFFHRRRIFISPRISARVSLR